jgi:diaminohydroxyphosphoribosylaminopyrimidine deaminase/5-amino-6-(5-phosphoribosylamino)uracil reductase
MTWRLFTGGVLIGAEGHPALGPLALAALADASRPRLLAAQALGVDVFSSWQL